MKWMLTLLVALGFAGCSQEVPNVPPPHTPAPVPAAAASAAPALADEKVTVVLSGAECGEPPVAIATVDWDAGTLAPGGVAVYVESPGNARKLWVEAGPKDVATTGKWVFAGTKFTLQDRVSGALLAQRSVDTIPCPSP